MGRFSGQIILVTGGSTGIGQATACAFAREGATVIIAGRRIEEGERTAALLRDGGAKAQFIRADVSVEDDVAHLFDQIIRQHGRLDIAVNSAGHEGPQRSVDEIAQAEWDAVMDVNLKGVWLSMKYEIQQMRRQHSGIIVNVATNLAYVGVPGLGAYSAAKAGVLALTRVAALEVIREGIRINAASPGPIGTPMAERMFGSIERQQEILGPLNPSGRVGRPDEVAAAILWLSSPESAFVVGQDIVMDGGIVIQ